MKLPAHPFLLAIVATSFALPAAAQSVADVSFRQGEAVFWQPRISYDRLVLTVSGPDGRIHTEEFPAGTAPAFALANGRGRSLPDGSYNYELRTVPFIEEWVREAVREARASGNGADVIRQLREAGALPEAPPVQTGSFRIFEGKVARDDAVEGETLEAQGRQAPGTGAGSTGAGAAPGISGSTTYQAGVPGGTYSSEFHLNEDLIVTGSACVGFDCVDGELFGFDTIRMKENNLRVMFDDTSISSSFPRNDWQLLANDSANGGMDRFSIEDVTAGRMPFTIEAGARADAIFIDEVGRIGFGTTTPSEDLHVVSGSTPTLRLSQDASQGFGAQAWDVAGNDVQFLVRDLTRGLIPFRIRPGALTSSIDIASSGRVGMGTSNPDAALHVLGALNKTGLKVEDVSSQPSPRILFELENNGPVGLSLTDTSQPALANPTWYMGTVRYPNPIASQQGSFQISLGFSSKLVLQENGDLSVTGTVTGVSDRDAKRDFEDVDVQDVLERVSDLDITTWHFKTDEVGTRHMGPMAQDFREAFGLGIDERHISFVDADGVALAAIQALHELQQSKDEVIADLQERNEDLETRLAELESRMGKVLASLEGTTVSTR